MNYKSQDYCITTTDLFRLFVEPAGLQRDVSGAGTQDSLISGISSSALGPDMRRHSEDLYWEGRRGKGGEWMKDKEEEGKERSDTCVCMCTGAKPTFG